MSTSVAIIGAGIMGRVVAWQLLRLNYNVYIFDKDALLSNATQSTSTPSSSAYTAAGMLAPFCELDTCNSEILFQGMESIKLWHDIIASLDTDVDFRPVGSLVVAHEQDISELHHFKQKLEFKLKQKLELLKKEKLSAIDSEITNQFTSGLFFKEEACLCPPLVMEALQQRLLENGVQWKTATIENLTSLDLQQSSEPEKFDWIFDCRGLGAKNNIPNLRGVRGETILLHAPEVKLTRIVRLMHPRYKLYIVPRKKHHYIIGATEIESEDLKPITVHSALELLSAVYSVHKGFAEASIISMQQNCRPALPDNQPEITQEDNIIRINGLYRHGILLAPYLAHQAIQLIQQKPKFLNSDKAETLNRYDTSIEYS